MSSIRLCSSSSPWPLHRTCARRMLTADAPWPARPSSSVMVDGARKSQLGSPADRHVSRRLFFSRVSPLSGKMLMPASVDSQQAPQTRSVARIRWVRVQCLQCNETAVVKLHHRDTLESLRKDLTCRRCNASAPRIEPIDQPPFLSGRMTLALVGAGVAATIAYIALLFANAIDHQAVQNAQLSPNGGYYERMEQRADLPHAAR
jgi:hypothetical protein